MYLKNNFKFSIEVTIKLLRDGDYLLKNLFKDEIRNLEKLLNKDLSFWK